uniref:Uncharacterized protein n=1 Tax=Opuntia streptacantha TaxID=393608 RepID=A0A7C9ETK2_OPUST
MNWSISSPKYFSRILERRESSKRPSLPQGMTIGSNSSLQCSQQFTFFKPINLDQCSNIFCNSSRTRMQSRLTLKDSYHSFGIVLTIKILKITRITCAIGITCSSA